MSKKFSLILFFSIMMYGSVLTEKISNIIGYDQYMINQGLIHHLFSNESTYYSNGQLDFILIIEKLKENGILNVGFDSPHDVTITFLINQDPVKSLKLIADSLKALGYYHYYTKQLTYDESKQLTWIITLKAEAAIDPLMLSKELFKHNCKIVDIKKEGLTKWMYAIDTSNSIISKSTNISIGEKVDFRKPLKPYFLKIEGAKHMSIISRPGNQWFPNVVFYDTHLNVLDIVKENNESKALRLDIPETTNYIKIDDLYTLENIKSGLSVIIKE